MGIKVRLTGLHERRIQDGVDDAPATLEAVNVPSVPIPETESKLVLMATLAMPERNPLVPDCYLSIALECLPDGATIGDEFEIQFVKVRK